MHSCYTRVVCVPCWKAILFSRVYDTENRTPFEITSVSSCVRERLRRFPNTGGRRNTRANRSRIELRARPRLGIELFPFVRESNSLSLPDPPDLARSDFEVMRVVSHAPLDSR